MKNKDVSDIIAESLGTKKETLNESLVAQVKVYDLPTEALSVRSKSNHLELYAKYVENHNKVSAELDSLDRSHANPNHCKFRNAKLDEVHNLNATYLHELYFSNISDLNSEVTMNSLSYMRLTRDWGTFDEWQRDFLACCKASRNGWAITGFNMFTQSYMNYVIDQHDQHVPVGVFPVVVMDMWQHAYQADYSSDTETYATNMMKQLNWTVIENRLEKAEAIREILR